MSGSLLVRGDLGKWLATTANCALGVNQSQFSFSMRIQLVGYPTANDTVFGLTSGNAFKAIAGAFTTDVRVSLTGTTNITFDTALSLGVAYHFAGTINGTGNSYGYQQGLQGPAHANIGTTSGTASGIQIGNPITSLGNAFLISDFAIWNGHQLTPTEVLALRDRTSTPATLGNPATSWWTLQGTAGHTATTSGGDDVGLQDQMAAANHLTTISTSGTATATYSATDLVYIPPITVEGVDVSRYGSIVTFYIGTNPANGSVVPAYPSSVNANPTISVNGTPVTGTNIQGPFWSSPVNAWSANTMVDPFVCYQILPPILDTDVVTWAAPSQWVGATAGYAGIDSGTADNFVGSWERGHFGYPAFNFSNKFIQIGYNGTGVTTHEACIAANAAHRLSNNIGIGDWQNVAVGGLSSDGWPQNLVTPWVTSNTLWKTDDTNGVNSREFPAPAGPFGGTALKWTVIYDENNVASPMTNVKLTCNGNGTMGAVVPVSTVSTGANSATITFTQTLIYNGSPPNQWNLSIGFTMTTPDHSMGVVSASNLWIEDPGGNQNRLSGAVVNPNYLAMMTPSAGVHPAFYRTMFGSDGENNNVVAADLISVNAFSYADSASKPATGTGNWPVNFPTWAGARSLPIYKVHKYNLAVSPSLFSIQKYSGPSLTFSAGGYLGYQATAPSYDWPYPNQASSLTAIIELEFALSDGTPVPHNLHFGQAIQLGNLSAIGVTNSNGSGHIAQSGGSSGTPYAYPTSNNRVVCVVGTTGLTAATGMAQVSAASDGTIVNLLATFLTGTTGTIPLELNGELTQAAGNCGLFIGVGAHLCDAGLTSFFTRLFNSTTRGTKIYVQYSNEIQIPNNQFTWLNQISNLLGYPNIAAAYISLSWNAYKIARTVWGSDSASVMHNAQVFELNSSTTAQTFAWAQANSIEIHRVSTAPYMDMDFSAPMIAAAAAIGVNQQLTLGNTDGTSGTHATHVSAAHTDNGGGGIQMPINGWVDIVRAHTKYNRLRNGTTSYNAGHVAAITAAGYGTGGQGNPTFTFPFPTFCYYEAAPTDLIPPGVSPNSEMFRAALTHDLEYSPGYADICTAFVESMQQSGATGSAIATELAIEALNGFRQGGTGAFLCQDPPSGGGTASVTGGSATMTLSAAATNINGQSIRLAGDTTHTYTASGSGTAYTISPVYAGTTNAAASIVALVKDNAASAMWGTNIWQDQLVGDGSSNKFFLSDLGGDTDVHDFGNVSVNGYAYGQWMAAQSASPSVSYTVSPLSVLPNIGSPITLSLAGTNTSWSGSSTVSVTNSLSGTTTVTKGTFTAASTTSATLTITTGAGTGTFKLTIDGTDSPTLSVTTPASFTVFPTPVLTGQTSFSLALTGIGTAWTSGSVVSIQNSLTGTTNVSIVSFVDSSSTAASLTLATGSGIGTFSVTIDGITSPSIPTATASFTVSPSQLLQNQLTPVTLLLTGFATMWTSGSTVTVVNSVTGTTTVTAGTFTDSSNTLATLTVTAGSGTGTFTIAIDGVSSPPLSVSSIGFVVAHPFITQKHTTPITLTLTGVGTNWNSGSTVSVTNSLKGTTSVTAGTFTAISTTSATLAITTGMGAGAFQITIDGIASPVQSVGSSTRFVPHIFHRPHRRPR